MSKTGFDLIAPLPPILSPLFLDKRDLSRYTHLPGSIPWGSLDIIKRIQSEGLAHDFHYLLLLKSRYMHLFSVYNIGIPLFLENKSYPGIPTPRKLKSVTIPTTTSGSSQKVKPLDGNIGGQKPVSTSLHPPLF